MIRRLIKILLGLIVIAAIALTIFWFARPEDVSFDEVRASVPHSQHSRFADIDGIRLHYQEKGTGPPLVLMHGLSSSTYTWKDVFEPLAKSFRVIAVDLKGHGFSAKPDGDYTRRAQAALVTHLLDHMQIDKAWFAGNSMGGEIALNIGLQNPQRVEGLILIDSAGVNVPGNASLTPAYTKIPVIGRILVALAMTSDKLVRQSLATSLYDDSKVTDERVAAYYRPLRTRGGQLAAVRARAQFQLLPVESDLGRVNAPTLIIWGAEDPLFPTAAARKLNSLIRNSKLVIFEKCGHQPQEELPERFVDELIRFVEESSALKK